MNDKKGGVIIYGHKISSPEHWTILKWISIEQNHVLGYFWLRNHV